MEVVWVGPRARMGISEAIPNRVVPHTTSGRADYFGPLVNRCIRPLMQNVTNYGGGGACGQGVEGDDAAGINLKPCAFL